jgi:hypothetical protein
MGQGGGGSLATTALSLVGSIAGSFLGGPIGGAIGGMAGGLVGSMLFNRSLKPLIPDMQFAGSSYGHIIPIIYGTVRLPATIFWESTITTSPQAGKGMGASTYNYYQSAALGFCVGPAKLLQIWTDGNLFYDGTAANPIELVSYSFPMRIYEGGEDQMQDVEMAAWVAQHVSPPYSCPAYRGLMYVVFSGINLIHFGNRFPNVTATVSSNVANITLVTPLVRPSPDVSLDTGLQSVVTDWVRGVVYQLSGDGTIRGFTMSTGICFGAIAQQTAQLMVGYSVIFPTLETMACAQGGNVYVSGSSVELAYFSTGDPLFPSVAIAAVDLELGVSLYGGDAFEGIGWSQPTISLVDPNSLEVHTTIAPTNGEGVSIVSGTGSGDYIDRMTAVTLASATGNSLEIIACVSVFAYLSVVDFSNGTGIALPMPYSGAGGWADAIVGNQNPTAGTVDIWWMCGSALEIGLDGPQLNVYISTVTAVAASVGLTLGGVPFYTSLVPVGTYHAADFGVETPYGWRPSTVAVYDAADNTMLITDLTLGRTIKLNTGGGVEWSSAGFPMTPISGQYFETDLGTAGGGYWQGDLNAGAVTAFDGPDPLILPAFTFAYSSNSSSAIINAAGSGNLYLIYLQRNSGAEYPVASIIVDQCTKAGLSPEQIDVSLVTATTIGYAITENKSAGACIADLLNVYQIDMVESDYTLKFVPKGQGSILTITQDDLGSTDAADPSKFWQGKDAQEQELPLQLNIRYTDPDLDYQPGGAYAKRTALPVPTQFSRRVKSVDLPVVATNLEAMQIAEKWLYTLWAQRKTYSTVLSPKYLALDPTDVITVVLDNGNSYTVRAEENAIGADFSMQLSLMSENSTVYQPSALPGASVSFTNQTLTPGVFCELFLFNVPLLEDSDDLGGTASRIYYAAGSGTILAAGTAEYLYKSTDGSTFPPFDTLTQFISWGRARNILAAPPAVFATDYVSTLTVVLPPGAMPPSSCAYLDLMNGVNPALVGSEIIQFQTVTENTDGSLTLSTLLRGVRGTDWAAADHGEGETVLFLAPGPVYGNKLPLAQLNVGEFWKLTPAGRTPGQTPTESFVYQGYDLKPYAPVQFARAASGADLVLSWVRRTRIGGLQQDGIDTVPLSEESEQYQVYLLANAAALAAFDPTVPATYVRSFLAIPGPTVTYTAAMMTADGFTPATETLYLVGYQISAAIGRGFQAYAALAPF